MGQRMTNNFNKKYGDKFCLVFQDKQLSPAEQETQNENIAKAFSVVLAGILGRTPTPEELLGLKPLNIPEK